MDHFQYRNGVLHAEDVSLKAIAETVGTPFYCYSRATIERHFDVFSKAFDGQDVTVCFAVKANSNLAVISTLAKRGAGADVVSGGELTRALRSGVDPAKIVFSGVGKTEAEMAQALKAGVMQINLESEPELEALSRVASSLGTQAPIAIRINPDVDAGTHEKITTGKSENKFGIEWTRVHEVYSKARDLPGIKVQGIAMHIGSQLLDLRPFKEAYRRTRDLLAILRADGHAITHLDLGGGLGIPYEGQPTPSPEEYAAVVREETADLGCHIILEPGRLMVGNAGVLVSSITYVKEGATRSFLIIDAAMNDLLRPTLYNAYHDIWPVDEAAQGHDLKSWDVVGPICETGDTFGKQRSLPDMRAGDLLVVRTAGAYGAVMAGTYNSRPLVPEVMVDGAKVAVIRRRMELEDFLAFETVPDWING